MRNPGLRDALRDFALESAALLTEELNGGAELRFEVVGEPGSGPTLYCYRPLTAEFIAERWDSLRRLDSCPPAASALGAGAAPYLRVSGLGGADAEPALRAMLERLYEDATGFAFPEERFKRVYAEVERTLYGDTIRAIVAAPLHGLLLERDRAELGDGLALARGSAIDVPPESVWSDRADSGHPLADGAASAAEHGVAPAEDRERGGAATMCVLERDIAPDGAPPVTEARLRFRRLLTALRLFKTGGVALGALGWTRVGEGRWQPLPIGSTGAARGERWDLEAGEETELSSFLGVLERSRRAGPVAWALARFELGCERPLETEALSDFLLALQALLDAGGEAGRAGLPLRLAALCAEEAERRAVQRRVELALALERFVIGGGRGESYVDTVGSESPRTLVSELERHLRALLRDVLCGHLDPALRRVADGLREASVEQV
jgi:hypothetical protein